MAREMPPSLFPDAFPTVSARVRAKLGLGRRVVPRSPQTRPKAATNPCRGCPLEGCTKVPPTLPHGRRLLAIGLGPGPVEERTGEPFTGDGGQVLREGLRAAGIDPDAVGYANLTRCRPPDGFGSPQWERAANRCIHYLQRDVAQGREPLLLLGGEVYARLVQDGRVRLGAGRGLWEWASLVDRLGYVLDHPAGLLRQAPGTTPAAVLRSPAGQTFVAHLRRMAERLGRLDAPPDYPVHIYRTPAEAEPFLRRAARRQRALAFDMESFDARETPGRRGVATDPCHPDFRLRGVAIGWEDAHAAPELAWIECAPWEERKAEARELFDPVFSSPAAKIAHTGHVDEQALVYPGWTTRVVNRSMDVLLMALALGDGTRESNKVSRLTVDLLGVANHWAANKSAMRDLPIEQVAYGACGDVLYEYRMARLLWTRLQRGEYL